MDRIVYIRRRAEMSQDDYGHENVNWYEQPIWAERRELRGDERYLAQQRLASIDGRYFVHYREDITPQDILVDNDKYYDIHAILPIGRREGLELIVSHREGHDAS